MEEAAAQRLLALWSGTPPPARARFLALLREHGEIAGSTHHA
jgi:hypothetical protein